VIPDREAWRCIVSDKGEVGLHVQAHLYGVPRIRLFVGEPEGDMAPYATCRIAGPESRIDLYWQDPGVLYGWAEALCQAAKQMRINLDARKSAAQRTELPADARG